MKINGKKHPDLRVNAFSFSPLSMMYKTKLIASGPITLWQRDWETMETVTDFILGGPKSLRMVTAAMKLKDTPWKKSYD